MKLNISQVKQNNQFYVKIQKSNDFKEFTWVELIKTIKQFQDTPFIEEKKDFIIAEWVSFLSILRDLSDLRDLNNFEIICSKEAENKIQETIENQNKLSTEDFNIKINDKDIENLKNLGFSKITLTKFQKRDLKTLLKLTNGANFSVQGSGKTAVTLATHLLLRNNKKSKVNSLLVVAPKMLFWVGKMVLMIVWMITANLNKKV